jgi:hypothetical protein
VVPGAGDDDGVGGGEHVRPGLGHHPEAVRGGQGAGFQAAGHHLVERAAGLVDGGAEQEGREGGVEPDDRGQQQDGDAVHTRVWHVFDDYWHSCHWYSGPREARVDA